MGQLRDYVLVIPNGGGKVSAEVDGDFFLIRKCEQSFPAGVTPYASSSDIIITCEFDDSGKISRRAGEGGSRPYKRVTFSIERLPPNWPQLETRITVALGYGQLYSEREDSPVSTKLTCSANTIPPNGTAQISSTGNFSIKEIRLNIPSTEAGGLWYSSEDTFDGNREVWLEKGVVEFIDYSGNLFVHNRNATAVKINVGYFLRSDY